MDHHIRLRVNGNIHEVNVGTEDTLLDVIREKLYLTGTKDGCQVGECGACTVILDGRPVNSCLVLAVEVDGCEVTTVEGLTGTADVKFQQRTSSPGELPDGGLEPAGGRTILGKDLTETQALHPLQQAFVEHGAVQCGFCTPGMLMSAKALLDETPNPKEEQIRRAIRGNLCRCTGYKKIEQAIRHAAEIVRGEC